MKQAVTLIFICFLILLVGLRGKQEEKLGGKVSPVDQLISNIKVQLESGKSIDGVYPIITPTTSNGITYSVDSVVVWDGNEKPKETDYVIHLNYLGQEMVTGTGSINPQLFHDWQVQSESSMVTATDL